MTSPNLDLRKTATISPPPAEAFELFTKHMTAWWPLATHSVGMEQATGVEFEPEVGGRIVEAMADGSTSIWGTVELWEPPDRVRFTWHPGNPPEEATRVEVIFRKAGSGTIVELIHTGWEARPDGNAARAQYDPGWDFVFGLYAEAGAGVLEKS
jgi:uncharacterized protein YndB with AHSA1/START domain